MEGTRFIIAPGDEVEILGRVRSLDPVTPEQIVGTIDNIGQATTFDGAFELLVTLRDSVLEGTRRADVSFGSGRSFEDLVVNIPITMEANGTFRDVVFNDEFIFEALGGTRTLNIEGLVEFNDTATVRAGEGRTAQLQILPDAEVGGTGTLTFSSELTPEASNRLRFGASGDEATTSTLGEDLTVVADSLDLIFSNDFFKDTLVSNGRLVIGDNAQIPLSGQLTFGDTSELVFQVSETDTAGQFTGATNRNVTFDGDLVIDFEAPSDFTPPENLALFDGPTLAGSFDTIRVEDEPNGVSASIDQQGNARILEII